MNFRTKLLLVTIFPIVVISFATLWLINAQYSRLSAAQSKVVEQMIRESKQAELENYVTLARTAIEPFYRWDNISRLQAQKQVAEVVTQMTFGEDGYFFVSRTDGVPLQNPLLSELEEHEKFETYDREIKRITSGLLEADPHNGALHQYKWIKPSTGTQAEKIARTVDLDYWDWVIGSGLYMDDISAQIGQVQQKLDENVAQTRWVLLAMAAGAIALTALLLGFIRFSEQKFADTRLKELASQIVDAQETERKRVSTELHDGISQLLVSARYSLDLASENAKRNKQIREPVEKSMQAISTAISEIRRISMALRPSILDDVGLSAALKSLGADFEAQTGIKADVKVENVGTQLDDRQKTTLYRVAQEALANVAKHSNARQTSIELVRDKSGVRLLISDNGKGLPVPAQMNRKTGMGLRNLRERLESHGGEFAIRKGSPAGTVVDVFIPSTKPMVSLDEITGIGEEAQRQAA